MDSASVHGRRGYWRIMRAAATAAKWNCRACPASVNSHPQSSLQISCACCRQHHYASLLPPLSTFIPHNITTSAPTMFLRLACVLYFMPSHDACQTDQMMGKICAEAVGGRNDYLRYVGRSEAERAEQRKAARLSLDTSAHAGSEYQRFMRVLSQVHMHGLAPKHLVLRGIRQPRRTHLACSAHRSGSATEHCLKMVQFNYKYTYMQV